MNHSSRASQSAIRLSDRSIIAAALIAFLIPLVFAAITGQIWEDYYITFRNSRHLVEGHGLVYEPGERLHTFTSPLGVLLPALAYLVSGNETVALWIFRVLSATALAAAAVMFGKHARDQLWTPLAYWFALVLSIFEAKTVAFSSNGMETAFMVLFTALTWREVARPNGPRWHWLALGFSGLMWTRPDSCVIALALIVCWHAFSRREPSQQQRQWWRQVVIAIIAGALLYAPWIAWAWSYYGSPVPHTIIAKSALAPGISVDRILAIPLHLLTGHTGLDGMFAPIYYFVGGWSPMWNAICRVLTCAAAFLWIVPFFPRAARAASLAVSVGAIYLYFIMPYPWYYPAWGLIAAGGLGSAITAVRRRGSDRSRSVLRISTGVIATAMLGFGIAQTYSSRVQQDVIEDAGRRKIGLWLRENSNPGDTVFAEPIGYIGYFSQLKMLDFPGLCAPEVSELVRSGERDHGSIITALKPSWLVLRPVELVQHRLEHGGVLDEYYLAGFWNQLPTVQAIPFLPGRNWLGFDSQFLVFRRTRNEGVRGRTSR